MGHSLPPAAVCGHPEAFRVAHRDPLHGAAVAGRPRCPPNRTKDPGPCSATLQQYWFSVAVVAASWSQDGCSSFRDDVPRRQEAGAGAPRPRGRVGSSLHRASTFTPEPIGGKQGVGASDAHSRGSGGPHIPSKSRGRRPRQNQVKLARKKGTRGLGVGDRNTHRTPHRHFQGSFRVGVQPAEPHRHLGTWPGASEVCGAAKSPEVRPRREAVTHARAPRPRGHVSPS